MTLPLDTLRTILDNIQIGADAPTGQQVLTGLAHRENYAVGEEPYLDSATTNSWSDPEPVQNSTLLCPELCSGEIPAEEQNARHLFGPAFNFEMILRELEDPIMRKFCVYNCNAGLFSGNYAHRAVVKMVQILSYIRLLKSNKIQRLSREGTALFQAYAMAELFGPNLPANYRLPEKEARREIISAVHWYAHSEDIHLEEEWFNAHLGLGATKAEALAITENQMNIHQALLLLEVWAGLTPTSSDWLNGLSLIANVLVSLAKKGVCTNNASKKIIEAIKIDHLGNEVFLSEKSIHTFYTNFSKHVNENNTRALFQNYAGTTPEASIRLMTTINQTVGSGMTVFTLIRRALNEQSDFPYWGQCAMRFNRDFVNYRIAQVAVGDNQYYGLRRNLGDATAAKFKNLGYLAQQLLIHHGKDVALANYGGFNRLSHRLWIDNLIKRMMRGELVIYQNPTAEALAAFAAIRDFRA